MAEERVCPVCEKVIPEDARFLCPYCHFELKWLDDEENIEKRKISFESMKQVTPSSVEPKMMNVSKFRFFLSGVLGVLIFSVTVELKVGHFYSISAFIFGLPFGLLAGYISFQLAKKNKLFSHRFSYWFLPIIISVIVSVIFWIQLF